MKARTQVTGDVIERVRLREMIAGGRVGTIREAAGLSLGEVARTLGVSRSCVFRWEHGQVPRGDMASRYLHLLLTLQNLARR